MFYEPARRNHGLPHDPLKALVAPRPIGWISTLAEDGTANLAPYSFFNLVSENPSIVMFSSAGIKDSARNAIASGEFVCNLATLELIKQVNLSSKPIPPDQSEFELTGLATAPSRMVKPPRVAATPCALECVVTETLEARDRHGAASGRHLIFGEIVGVHLDEAFIEDGLVRTDRLHALARCGYFDFAWVEELRSLPRPA
ncbi:flavin reductase family protein [Ancylobacter mangrovi]|uniref:flavin reductase family protein n=1 Tax=Ancylobacter mangrovi TaxID=2972472 RepID=UPI0021631494|nr:flavin reductase family protein [Ancylobacter mangrovi]MCS0501880.1 flavin reductase family protein [Ancylobacter mangrovi]